MQKRMSTMGPAIAAGVVLAGSAVAADAPPPTESGTIGTIESIEVTARRVTENLQTVPIAVTAFSEATIERQQITSTRALDAAIPNIVFVPNTGQASAATIFLRGVGEDESFFTADPPVGVYVDDVYIPRQTGALFDLYDVERMEVLRGPQGTLYGRNTSGGAIKLISRRPSFTFGTNAEVRLGSYDRRDFKGSITGPIVGETLAGQLAVLSRRFDGYTKDLTTGRRVNDQDLQGARGSLLWKPSERFDVLAVADAIRERSGPGYAVAVVNDTVPARLAQVPDWNDTTSDLLGGRQDVDQRGVSLNATYSGDVTIRSISAWRKLDQDLLIDADGRVGNPGNIGAPPGNVAFHLAQQQHQDQLSEELQASGKLLDGRADYVTGVYWFRERNRQRTANIALVPASSPPYARNHTFVTLETDSVAAFANGKYRFTDALSVSAGVRWTRDDKDFHIEARNAAGAVRSTTFGAPAVRNIKQAWSAVTPRVSFDWNAKGDGWSSLTYLTAAKGFKSGSFDGREGTPDYIVNGLRPIDPETVWSYELGLKADWLDSRLRTNLAAFLNRYKDMQFGITKADGSGFTRLNAGDARIRGFEAEITTVPVQGLEIYANLGLLDGEYTKFRDPGACFLPSEQAAKDRLQLKKAPKVTWRVGANYTLRLAGGGAVLMGGDYSEKSKFFHNLCNSPVIATTGYENLNAQIGYETPSGRWRVTASGSNLTNAVYWQGGFDFTAALGDAVYVVPPRQWALAVRYAFGP